MPDAFDKWLADVGNDIAEEIHDKIKSTSGHLSVNDGNHAIWHEGDLAIMLVLPYEHAMCFNMEAIEGDYESCPLHSYVFSTITELIMRATSLLGGLEDEL